MIDALDELSREELLMLARRGAPSPATIAHIRFENLSTRTHAAYVRWQASSKAASVQAREARVLGDSDGWGANFSAALATAHAVMGIAQTDWVIYRRAKAKSDGAWRIAQRLARDEGRL